MVRYVFVSQSLHNRAFYQKLMARIRFKYELMARRSKETRRRVRKWIGNYQAKNRKHVIQRAKQNAAATILLMNRKKTGKKGGKSDSLK